MKYLLTYKQLLESKEENVLKKIQKFFKCDYVAKKAVELHPKLAVWIVNSFKQYIFENYDKLKESESLSIVKIKFIDDKNKIGDIESKRDITKEELNNYFKTGKDIENKKIFNFTKSLWDLLSPKYQSIVDWAQSFDISPEDRKNLTKMTLDEAYNKADEWHKSLKAGGVIEDEHGTVLMTFPDGFYWIDLETRTDRDEANAMGHCGNTNKGDTLYSLRDRNKQPHVTAAIDTDKGIIYQMKGKENYKPIEKYHKYIVALLTNDDLPTTLKGFGSEYDKKEDFIPEDLDKELYDKLIEKRPNINDPVFTNEEIKDMFGRFLTDFYFEESEYGFRAVSWLYDLYGGSGGTGLQNVIECVDKRSRKLFDILCEEYPKKVKDYYDEDDKDKIILYVLSYRLMADDIAKQYNIQLPNPKDSNSNKWNYLYKKLGDTKIQKIIKDNDLSEYVLFKDEFEEQFTSKDRWDNESWDYDEVLDHFFGIGNEQEKFEALNELFSAPSWEWEGEGDNRTVKKKRDTYCKETWDVFNASDVDYKITSKLTIEEMEDEMSDMSYYEYTGEY